MTEYWKPDNEVFDVLEIANIDLKFAREMIQNLYYSGEIKMNYTIHGTLSFFNMLNIAGHVVILKKADSKGDAFERLSDRSWASDLI